MSFPVDTPTYGLVRCAHKVGRKRRPGGGVRDVEPVRDILEDIRDRSHLLAERYPGVFAYKIDLVPTLCRQWVFVVFEVEAARVQTMRCRLGGTERDFFEYYEIATAQGEYLPVDVLGFVNAPGFETYRGSIRYRDTLPRPAVP